MRGLVVAPAAEGAVAAFIDNKSEAVGNWIVQPLIAMQQSLL